MPALAASASAPRRWRCRPASLPLRARWPARRRRAPKTKCIASYRSFLFSLLARLVAVHHLDELLLVRRRQLRPVDLQRQLVELAGELERGLIVLVVHGRAGVGADV